MDRYTKKRVIVTGGAGFFGSHLCEKLLENGNILIYIIRDKMTPIY